MDVHNPATRSYNMAQIRSKNTSPELRVRSLVHKLGYRFRLHSKVLPGKPDLVFKKYKTVLFVNGCFWHRHDCKNGQQIPKTNSAFWKDKFTKNQKRDLSNYSTLKTRGWTVAIMWECEIHDQIKLEKSIQSILTSE